MSPEMINLIANSTGETLYLVALAALIATAFGLPLGVFLATSGKGELFAAPWVNRVLGVVVNATRSTPFIILVVAIIPFTRLIAGTSIGTNAAIVPLTIAATPFIARLIEGAMVGAVGGGGLVDLGIRYGYQRFMPVMLLAVVVVLIVLVQAVQSIGDRLARNLNKRIRHA